MDSTAWAALATFLGVAVALIIAIWGPWLGGLFFKPKLRLSIEMRPPDCIKIQALVKPAPDVVAFKTDSYHCRLRITNDGNRAAEDVEVKLLRLRVLTDGGPREDEDFLPLNLLWADIERETAPKIQPKLDRHCTLCRMLEFTRQNPLLDFVTQVEPFEVRPGTWPMRKRPGNYLLDIAVSANNARVIRKTLRISFRGWFDKPNEMFTKGLVIAVVD